MTTKEAFVEAQRMADEAGQPHVVFWDGKEYEIKVLTAGVSGKAFIGAVNPRPTTMDQVRR